MLDLETLPKTVELVANCTTGDCLKFAAELRIKLEPPKYTRGVSVMDNPATLVAWRAEHRTARKRSDRCGRLGYVFSEIDYSQFDDDIFRINTSLEQRQGRPMSNGYRDFIRHGRLPDYPCEMHNIRTYGVLKDGVLRAYMTLYRCGELALVSMILGDGTDDDIHRKNGVMFLLFEGMVTDQAGYPGIVYYNRHDSGDDGLRFYKERVGFREGDVEWVL